MISRRAALALPALLGACSPQDLANALTPRGTTAVQEGISYGPGERGRYDLYTPQGAMPDTPLIVFFYGGGWRSGDRGEYGFVARPLAALGALVAVPDYRLFPAVRWPAFVEDGAAALRAVAAGPGAGRPVIVMGHSAGAFIALALALDPRWLGRPGRDALAGGIGLAGPYDFGPEDDPDGIFAAAPGKRARAAPAEESELLGVPPLLLLHGTDDTTVRPEQTRRLATRARAQGVPVQERLYPGVGHIGILASISAPARTLGLSGAPVLEDIAGWLPGIRRSPSRAAPTG
ncbi:alpha/beta hydrolase [Muricoccus radiodurans]|uniref:alpha/beta hydrolase n=1 Tax=Muricoccus radiodurans TaxID=2231721 RepID=UPI003CF2B842